MNNRIEMKRTPDFSEEMRSGYGQRQEYLVRANNREVIQNFKDETSRLDGELALREATVSIDQKPDGTADKG